MNINDDVGMTIPDLIQSLRERINPDYAIQRGTESYERRICAEALEAQQAEIARLRVVTEVAMNALDVIATTPRNKGAKRNAYAALRFLETQLDAAPND